MLSMTQHVNRIMLSPDQEVLVYSHRDPRLETTARYALGEPPQHAVPRWNDNP